MSKKNLQHLTVSFLILLVFGCRSRENDNPFCIKTYNLKDSLERLGYLSFLNDNQIDTLDRYSDINAQAWSDTISSAKIFFEDDKYLVIGTSMGEFGGSIIFSDKKTGLNYFLSCTDPLMVDFKNGYYYVTEQFCSASYGRTRILKIKDPTSLVVLNNNELPRGQRQRDSIGHANSELIKELYKEIVLIDTANVTASIFYPYKNKNYLIYSTMNDGWIQFDEMDTTFLGEIRNGSLITLDTILSEPTWTMDFEPGRIMNGIYAYKYRIEAGGRLREKLIESKGRIFIKDDTIVIGHSYRDARKMRPGGPRAYFRHK